MKLSEKIYTPRSILSFVLAAGLLSLFVQEALARNGMAKAAGWILDNPALAAMNLLIIYCLVSLLVSTIGKPVLGAMVCAVLLLMLSVINHEKIVHLHQPLFSWDLLQYDRIYVLLPALIAQYTPKYSLAFIPAAAIGLLYFLVRTEKSVNLRTRAILFCLPFFLLTGLVYHRELHRDFPSLLATENLVWNQKENYEKNGFLLALGLNIQQILIDEPDNYGKEAIEELLKDAVAAPRQTHMRESRKPVNLVLFMSESFYDLMYVKYETDIPPLGNWQRLFTKYPTFRMISPTFGGNTSNVEFEMLTGMSNAFLPPGGIPYDHYIRSDTPSMAGILKGSGYTTIAIHPYYDWFWSRNTVYPLLGFDDFISLSGFSGAKKRGWFVADESLVDKIIQTIDGSESPLFIHAISMQNHGPYEPHRYSRDEPDVRAELPEKLRLALQTYITGLRDADRQLSRLLEYLENKPEPTICLFCGDHLPSFGKEYALYRESGAVQSEPGDYTLQELFRMASIPCLLWANQEDLLDIDYVPENVSPVYFPAILLHQMGIEMPAHIQYLSRGIQDFPVIHRQFVWKPDGELQELSETREDLFVRGLEMLQYDILFGERYSLTMDSGKPQNPEDDC